MQLVKRLEWGAPTAESPAETKPVREGMAVHYNGPTTGLHTKEHSACFTYWKGIYNFHTQSNGWSDIGYAWGACPHGWVFEGRGFDKHQAAQGAGGNGTHQACQFMLGGSEQPTQGMLDAWYDLRANLMGRGVGTDIKPHSFWMSTSCPGDYLRARINDGTLAQQPGGGDPPMPDVYTTAAGDSLLKVANEGGLTVNELLSINASRYLYMEAGKTYRTSLNPYANGLPQVNSASPSAKSLQIELKRVGYLAQTVALSDNYGPATQNAVTAFYQANPQFGWVGSQIGPLGWSELQAEETASFNPGGSGPFFDPEPAHNYTRVTYDGRTINTRTKIMLDRAAALLNVSGFDLSQGSYSDGANSAGTHSGGGAVDINSSSWTMARALREVGFAAWVRTPSEGPWGYHIHGIAIGDQELSGAAQNQVVDYFAGRNGLANDNPDTAPASVGRPYPQWCEQYR